MPKEKIAFFTISLMKGGAEKIVALLINELYKEYDIHLVLLRNVIEFDLPMDNITVHYIDNEKLSTDKQLIKILKLPMVALRLGKILKQQDIKLVVSFLNRPNFVSGLVKMFGWKGKAIFSERIFTLLEYPSNSVRDRLGRYLVRKLYPKADLVLPNSMAIAKSLEEDFDLDNKVIAVYNPINIAQAEKLSNEPATGADFSSFTFVSVCRLSEQKNHRTILAAVKIIESLPFQVLIIGKGEMEERLKQMAAETGIANKLQFMGFIANPLPYVAKSDCFLLTSGFEGFPNALLEALACSKPVISTDCLSGPREILTGSYNGYRNTTNIEKATYGILVPVDEPAMLADAMKEMMQNPAMAAHYASIAKGRAEDFDAVKIVDQFRTLFRDTLK